MGKRITKELRENGERWELLARLHGWNELAKWVETLGEKVYCRLNRDRVEAILLEKYDVKVNRGKDLGPTILTLGAKPPYIVFHERDIEGMRAAVAEYDARLEDGKHAQ
jgi:hypothetical protein